MGSRKLTQRMEKPGVVLLTGLQGYGKSTLAAIAGDHLGATVLAWDSVMAALRLTPHTRPLIDDMDLVSRREVGWTLLWQLATSELRRERYVVLDGIARADEVRRTRELAAQHQADCLVVHARCDDLTMQKSRIDRKRAIPGWYELDWEHVLKTTKHWEELQGIDLDLDTSQPVELCRVALLNQLAPGTSQKP